MARDPSAARPPQCLAWPQISLFGEVGEAMLGTFLDQLRKAEESGEDIALEITTLGGDAELGRRLVLEVEDARRRMRCRFVFLGKTVVYSAGATLMSAFPREDRYLTRDAVVMIHCRQLDSRVEISGPMRLSLPRIEALKRQIETGLKLEAQGFRRLIEGSDVTLDELWERAVHSWYLPAAEALERGLVAGIVDRPPGSG